MTDRVAGDEPHRIRRVAASRWTTARRKIFFNTLAETSNVTAAAQAAGMNRSAAYDRKSRDPAFARAWKAALERGYTELEMQLMRHSRNGTVRTEQVVDGEGNVKQIRAVHSYPLTVAMRLLMAHRQEVDAWRRQSEKDPAAANEIALAMAEMDTIRARLLGNKGECQGTTPDGVA